MYHTTQTLNFEFDLFDLVTSNDLELTGGHQAGRTLRKPHPHPAPSEKGLNWPPLPTYEAKNIFSPDI